MPSVLGENSQLDRASPIPLWQQLAGVIDRAIQSRRFLPDQALPSESDLIDHFGVSRTVVREALAELVRTRRIFKIRAKGSFVAPEAPELRFVGSMLGSSEDLARSGSAVTTQVLSHLAGKATRTEATFLSIAEGEPIIRLRRKRSVNGTPWLLVETTLPLRLFPGLLKTNLENRSLYEHLRRNFGVCPHGADRWLSACTPNPHDAALLQLEPGEPVLGIESVAWDANNVRFEYYRALHRSAQSRFYVGIR